MLLLDLLIVYLACGSPFAVYEATTRELGTISSRAGRTVFALVFWPLLATDLIRRRVIRSRPGGLDVDELEDIRQDIESRFFPDSSSVGIFEFRDSFYRFAGLDAASLEDQSTSTFEVFKVVNHPNEALASRILGRTNLKKIKEHKLRAGRELVDLLARNVPSDVDVEMRSTVERLSPTLCLPEPQEFTPVLDPKSADQRQACV